ncbi:hypothetical protein G6011_04023 [Alternaria panax]|uniref:NB-ARC domain-containing protein n=1 Tax=Alternaria panax TaxID=48097 RepID=A0AAD4NTL9_9PLEO|nr:hypothetical protein G6011_04023 [Alternaria panax]
MVEFIGVAAAIPQLAKYTFSAFNTLPDLHRRFQKAPKTVNRWQDDVSLLSSLAQYYRINPGLAGQVSVDVLDRFSECAEDLGLQFKKLAILPADGSCSRFKKSIGIIRKEREINQALVSIIQRNTLISSHLLAQPAIIGSANSAQSYLPSRGPHLWAMPISRTSSGVTSITAFEAICSFVGQENLLADLTRMMDHAVGRCVVMAGPSGIGKSYLVREFLCPPRKPHDVTVFWVDATTSDTISTSINTRLRRISLPEVASPSIGDPSAIMAFLESVVLHEWVLVLDNADARSVEGARLTEQLSRSTKGRVLITTRDRHFAFSVAQASNVIEIPAMSIADAKQLLAANSVRRIDNDSGSADLVRYLGYHPSAIFQAARYMTTHYLSSSQLVASLRTGMISLLAVLDLDPTTMTNPGSLFPGLEHTTMATTVARYLSLLSCLDHAHLDNYLLSTIACTPEVKQALALMKSYYMLRPASLRPFLQLDDLVAKLTIAVLYQRADRCQNVVSALDIVAQLLALSADGRQHRPLGPDFEHALCALRALAKFTTEAEVSSATVATAVAVGTEVCRHLVLVGRASEAIDVVEQLLSWGHNTMSSLHQAATRLHSKLGTAYHSVGLFEQAFIITRTALRAQCQLNGNHFDALHSLNNMGVLYQDQGLFLKAEIYHSKALELKQEVFGSQHTETYITLSNLALSLQSQKRFGEAERMHRRALRGRKRLLVSAHPDIYTSLNNLGVVLYSQGRLHEAKGMHEVALTGRETVLGASHLRTLKSKGNLALVLGQLGDNDRAIAMFQEVCPSLKQNAGLSHPETINSYRNAAIFLHREGKFHDAQTSMMEALAGLEERHGKGHEQTFGAHQYIAALLHLQGQLQEALDVAAWLFDMRSEILGNAHPDTECSREHVAQLGAELDASLQGSLTIFSCMN